MIERVIYTGSMLFVLLCKVHHGLKCVASG